MGVDRAGQVLDGGRCLDGQRRLAGQLGHVCAHGVHADDRARLVGDDFDESLGGAQRSRSTGGGEREPAAFRFPLSASGRARTLGQSEGTVTVVADGDGTVIGVQAVGAHVAELAGEAALAVETAATVEDLAGTIHAHPTLGESLMEAALGLAGRPVHTAR